MQKFLQGRVDLVRSLIDNRLASYADLVLIICAVLSACASRRWKLPPMGYDRKSFIELLVKYSPDDFRTSWVSVPSLLNDNLIDRSQTPYGNPGNIDRIYCDDEIDLSLEDAIRQYPEVLSKNPRRYCYASLIYERLRCKYVHEYCPHESITSVPPSRKEARISYIGRRVSNATIKRMISFHLDYLIKLAEHHITNIPPNGPSELLSSWWIDEV